MKKEHTAQFILNHHFCCYHCGDDFDFPSHLPLSLESSVALIDSWCKQHRNCSPTEQGEKLKEENDFIWEKFLNQKIICKSYKRRIFFNLKYAIEFFSGFEDIETKESEHEIIVIHSNCEPETFKIDCSIEKYKYINRTAVLNHLFYRL